MNRPSILKDFPFASLPAQAKVPDKGQEKTPERAGKKRTPGLYRRLAELYRRMEEAYSACAQEAGLSCKDCPTNCCTSFFRHHTYVEWGYLWRGLLELPEERRSEIVRRAEAYMRAAGQAIAVDALPDAMCPLNEDSLCVLYPYRLMICRMHGTRNIFTRPDGLLQIFSGCARFTALPCSAGLSPSGRAGKGPDNADDARCPTLDRTPFYSELAVLELDFLKRAARPLPRVNLTLAEMIILGPPKLR